jgi:hypothetical protein
MIVFKFLNTPSLQKKGLNACLLQAAKGKVYINLKKETPPRLKR